MPGAIRTIRTPKADKANTRMAYSETTREHRRCTATRTDGTPCKAFGLGGSGAALRRPRGALAGPARLPVCGLQLAAPARRWPLPVARRAGVPPHHAGGDAWGAPQPAAAKAPRVARALGRRGWLRCPPGVPSYRAGKRTKSDQKQPSVPRPDPLPANRLLTRTGTNGTPSAAAGTCSALCRYGLGGPPSVARLLAQNGLGVPLPAFRVLSHRAPPARFNKSTTEAGHHLLPYAPRHILAPG